MVLLVALPALARAQTADSVPKREPEQIEAQKLGKVPKQTRFVEAEYPREAADKGIEAVVVLLLDIDDKGKVTAVGLAEPADPPGLGFDEAAMAAAQQFEFEPAELDGKPIAVQITYKYRFTLKAKAPPPAAAPAPPPKREPVANLVGLLLERGTRVPMPGVVVTVFRDEGGKPVGFEASSDAEGRFAFYDLAPGEWRVLAEPPGYYPFRTTETVAAGQATRVTYYVERGSYNPFDVTITATRPRKEVSRTVIAAKEIDKIPGTAGDPLAVVQNFAGVARVPINGVLIVRGSAPEDSKVFVDGTQVPLIYHFGGLRSVIPVGMLDAIEFYPGNFAPMYGRATGGIIDVQIKRLAPERVSGYADVSILDTGVFLEAPIGKDASIAVAGRRSYIDFILNAVVPEDAGASLTTAPRYYDFQLVGNYRPAPAHDLRAFFFASDDRLELLFKNPASFDPRVTGASLGVSTSFYRSLLQYRYVPGPGFEHSVRVSQGQNWLNFGAGELVFDLDINTVQLRDNVRARLTDWLTLHGGVDVLYERASGFVRLPRPPKEGEPPRDFDPSQTLTTRFEGLEFWSPALFLEAELRPLEGTLVIPGVRLDYFERTDELVLEPRVTARQQVAETVTLKGGVGLFVQEPTFDETEGVFGNPELGVERALHYSAGVEWRPRPHLTLDATAFYKDLSDLVSQTDRIVTTPDGMTRPLAYDNLGSGRVYGLELVARHEFTDRFTGWLAYTLSRAERTDSGAPESRLFSFDQTHILTAVASYMLPRNWQVGARFRLVSGNPRTPVLGGVFNADADQYERTNGPVNSERNDPFHQLDLRVDKRWIYQRWILSLYLDIQNVYDHRNPEGVSYNYNFRESKPTTGLPILPIFGVRGEF